MLARPSRQSLASAWLRSSRLLLLAALLGGCQSLLAPDLAFDTDGGEAWTFDKLIGGRIDAGHCDQIELRSPAGTVPAWSDGRRFEARVPLQEGVNRVQAGCRGTRAAQAEQAWAVQLEDAPKAWIRLRVEDGTVHLDAGRTERAEGIPAPIVRYEWSARPDNPAPLIPVAGGEPIDQQPLVSEQLELRVPAADGEYYVTLRVFDALGRVDQSTGVFRVTAGEAAEVDLQREHPAWVDRAVVYGVVPFFFGPTGFRDVLERLEQIAALGVTAIWLSPVTAAPEGDFGYALADPFRVRAEFGTEAEFHALVQRAQALGLRVIMDFVPNHVSDRHRYYLDVARRGSRSPYYGWFERGAGGEIASYFDWDNLKNLDYDNPEVQNYVIAAFAYWVRRHGVDGFRVDAGWGVRQRAPEFWQRWREELKRIDPDLFLLAEASARDPYYVRSGFDAAYDWTEQLGRWAWQDVFRADGSGADLDRLRAALTNRGRGYPADTLILRFLNNNDTGERFIGRYGLGMTRVAAALQFTVPGVPVIYTGDEIGAEYEPYDEGPPLVWQDPHDLTPYYARLAALRRDTPALWSERLELVGNDQEERVLSFLRPGPTPAEDVLVVLNFSDRPLTARLTNTAALPSGRLLDLLGDRTLTLDPRRPALRLPAYGAVVLQAAP